MNDFIAGPMFRYLCFPIVGCALGVWIKYDSRPRGKGLKREDFTIGLDLVRNSLLMFLALTCERAIDLDTTHRLLSNIVSNPVEVAKLNAHERVVSGGMTWAGLTMSCMVLGLWISTSFVRHCGWEGNPSKPRILNGILVPDLLGLGTLYLVARYFSS